MFPAFLPATDNDAIAETVSASSVSRRRASFREQPSVEAERSSERQYLPEEGGDRGTERVTLAVSAGDRGPLTVDVEDPLHGTDSVGVGSLLQHGVRNRIQLEETGSTNTRFLFEAHTH